MRQEDPDPGPDFITKRLRAEFRRGNCLPTTGGMTWDETRVA
jgi:hypothetical protein